MQRIEVGRYNDEIPVYSGWIKPEREDEQDIPEWILYVLRDGTVELGIRNEDGELEF